MTGNDTEPADAEWIAIDWGTTNVRAWGLDAAGDITFKCQSDRGMGTLEPSEYPEALQALLGDIISAAATPCDLVICGMAGARQGWIEAPYLQTPADLRGLGAQSVVPPLSDPRFRPRILAGVCQTQPGAEDVMRGEETQIAGFLARRLDYAGLVCLPGTHSKWVRVDNFTVTGFSTVMTGELFETLRRHTVLHHTTKAENDPESESDGFTAGLHASFEAPEKLTGNLFKVRAAALLSGRLAAWNTGYLSGLLIGAELAAHRSEIGNAALPLIGTATLCGLYACALAELGIASERVDATEATLAGLTYVRGSLN